MKESIAPHNSALNSLAIIYVMNVNYAFNKVGAFCNGFFLVILENTSMSLYVCMYIYIYILYI